MHCFLCLFYISLLNKVFSGCFRQAFFNLGDKKKVVAGCGRHVVVLYSNDCMGICLGERSIVCLRQVVILQRWSFEQV